MGPNQRVLSAIAALITATGGTVPTRASGEHWNTYTLRCLESALSAAGVTAPAASGASWNDRVSQLLELYSTNATLVHRLPSRALADFGAKVDPSSVVSAVAQAAGAGGFLSATMANNNVASGLPNTGASWSVLAKNMGGTTRESDIGDFLSSWLLWAGDNDPPSADIRIMAGLADAPIGTETIGVGAYLQSSSTDWIAGHLVCTSSTWTATAASAASANTRGVRGNARQLNTITQRSVGAVSIDANSLSLTGTTATVPGTTAVADDLDYFFLAIGWVAGSGGTNGAVVKLYGAELLLRLTEITGTARPSA